MQKILIIGAGEAGKIIARNILEQQRAEIVGFLDDNPELHGKTFFKIPVLGPVKQLRKIAASDTIAQVIIAIPSVSGKSLSPIINEILKCRLFFQIVPGYYNFKTQDVDIQYPLRQINLADLLGRHSADLPIHLLSEHIRHKRILITGAGGSIGSEITRTLAMFHPKEIILMGRGEASIFLILNELKMRFPKLKIVSVIANCTDRTSMFFHFRNYKPDLVFHTAAHKHVPFMEDNPREAFYNNVMGGINVFDACVETGVDKVILLSTDKAVHPKCVMGMTKRILECLIQKDYSGRGTLFSGVRFGNVLGSRGSVVQLFQEQIERGDPITITHPKAARYFMTIPEASQLVITAGAIAEQGHIYVLDMGKQILIRDLALELLHLNGIDVQYGKLVYTGLRPGEKLRESLLLSGALCKTIHEKIWDEAPSNTSSLSLLPEILKIHKSLYLLSDEEIVNSMKRLIHNFERKNITKKG